MTVNYEGTPHEHDEEPLATRPQYGHGDAGFGLMPGEIIVTDPSGRKRVESNIGTRATRTLPSDFEHGAPTI